MSRINKIFVVGLLFSVLIFNLHFGLPYSCQTHVAMEPMSCCAAVNPSTSGMEKILTSSSCACQISENHQRDVLFLVWSENLKPYSKKINQYSLNAFQLSNFILKPPGSSKPLIINSQPTFTSNKKIYNLISSYLI